MKIIADIPDELHAIMKFQCSLSKQSIKEYVRDLVSVDLSMRQPELFQKLKEKKGAVI